MKMHRLILAPAIWLALTVAAAADKIPLAELSAYFNAMKTAEALFTQVNADGSTSTGTLYIQRPGRARFEYDPPEQALVMAGGGQVAIFDKKSNMPPEQFPLKRTPLNLILERKVDLGRARMVVGHVGDARSTTVVAQDPEHPEYGTIRMVFSGTPLALRQWIITDDLGGQTTVKLGEMTTGARLSSFLFNIPQEITRRGLN